uniref:Uncharacterized protein n=1 Tax=Vitrella brassicaformis TaxID=1169539 RepID=A0A7S1KEI3_9ALVE|mmetsp:Transcript_48328/g.120979  ORF Transcript_48328/g.120979 Transcript_48328/m.120979 type:complete len:181 (+) Transcript_48328:211-753(+)
MISMRRFRLLAILFGLVAIGKAAQSKDASQVSVAARELGGEVRAFEAQQAALVQLQLDQAANTITAAYKLNTAAHKLDTAAHQLTAQALEAIDKAHRTLTQMTTEGLNTQQTGDGRGNDSTHEGCPVSLFAWVQAVARLLQRGEASGRRAGALINAKLRGVTYGWTIGHAAYFTAIRANV